MYKIPDDLVADIKSIAADITELESERIKFDETLKLFEQQMQSEMEDAIKDMMGSMVASLENEKPITEDRIGADVSEMKQL